MKRGSRETKPRQSGAARLPLSVLLAVKKLVEYCWREEFRDYQTRSPQERVGHVFRLLLVIRRWLVEQGHDINQVAD